MTDERLNEAALRYRRDGYVFPFDAIGTARASEAARRVEKLLEQPPADLQHPWRIKMHLLCDWIFDLATDDTVLDGVESVIGPDILLQAADLFCKPPGGRQHINWHQDANYWNLEPFEICTAWIALTDARPENGCMRFMAGTHTRDKLCHRETLSQRSALTRGQEIVLDMDESLAVPVILDAGEMSLHHCLLAHASGINRTASPRIAVAVRYLPAHVRQTAGPALSAIPVRGRDTWRHFIRDTPPDGSFTARSIAAHARAMARHAASGYATA